MISPLAQVITLGKDTLLDTIPILTTKDNVVCLHELFRSVQSVMRRGFQSRGEGR